VDNSELALQLGDELQDAKDMGLSGIAIRAHWPFARFICPILRRAGYVVRGSETNKGDRSVKLTILLNAKLKEEA
jgi:hypothetical protein